MLLLTELQNEVNIWATECFGEEATKNKDERNHRFLEEALEMVQSTGCTKEDALDLVDYVFNREVGDPFQEAGGVLISFAALCNANEIEMSDAACVGIDENWDRLDIIREKQRKKPKFGPRAQ